MTGWLADLYDQATADHDWLAEVGALRPEGGDSDAD